MDWVWIGGLIAAFAVVAIVIEWAVGRLFARLTRRRTKP